MNLQKLPGAPGYMVDTDAMIAYSFKRGFLKPIKTRAAYKSCTIHVDGKSIGTTIWRMMYCIQRQIDITKLPEGIVIARNRQGNIALMTRAEVNEKAVRTYKAKRENLERLRISYGLIEKFYKGERKPLLDYIGKAEKDVMNHYIYVRGLGKDRAELIVANAVNKLLDRFREGRPVVHIKTYLYRLARGENDNYAKRIMEFVEQIENDDW